MMFIRYSVLRKLLREVAVSPSVFKNNQPVQDPVDKKGVASAMKDIGNSFKSGLVMNLTLASADKYNSETREFDDAAYQQIEKVANAAVEQVVAKINDTVKTAWVQAHKQIKGGS
jgi:hypothetical protein